MMFVARIAPAVVALVAGILDLMLVEAQLRTRGIPHNEAGHLMVHVSVVLFFGAACVLAALMWCRTSRTCGTVCLIGGGLLFLGGLDTAAATFVVRSAMENTGGRQVAVEMVEASCAIFTTFASLTLILVGLLLREVHAGESVSSA